MRKISNLNNRTKSKICLKLANKALEGRQWYNYVAFLVNFEHSKSCYSIFIVDFGHVMLAGIKQKFCFSFQKNMYVHWSQRKLRVSHTLYYQRHIPIIVTSVVLHYEQLCRAPTSVSDGIFLQYFATLNFDGFSTNVSQILPLMLFFGRKRAF